LADLSSEMAVCCLRILRRADSDKQVVRVRPVAKSGKLPLFVRVAHKLSHWICVPARNNDPIAARPIRNPRKRFLVFMMTRKNLRAADLHSSRKRPVLKGAGPPKRTN
jgi:hypothetical protein